MDNLAIEVENLSKAYQLGQFDTGALAYDIKRWWALKRGKEDPFLAVGEENDRTVSEGPHRWSGDTRPTGCPWTGKPAFVRRTYEPEPESREWRCPPWPSG